MNNTKEALHTKTVLMVKEPDISLAKLNTGGALILDRGKNEIKLLAKDQSVQLTISITDKGLILNLNALNLNINALEEINLTGNKIKIQASNELSIVTDGNLVQQVGKDLSNEVAGINSSIAKVQNITADLGNVNIKANDDVRLDGERIKLNCD